MIVTSNASAGLDRPLSPEVLEHEERIKKLLLADPYQPFEVILSTGVRIVAPRQFSLAIGQKTMAAAYRPKGMGMMFPKALIVGVNVLESAD